MKVWDLVVRLLHWSLALAITIAWTSTLGLGFSRAHEPAGYVAVGIIGIRIVWGITGSHYARFSQFLRGYKQVLRYAAQLQSGKEARFIGHNPLGGWMVMMLLGVIATLALTGWLYTTDYFWGMGWLDTLHYGLAWLLLVLIAVHLCGVIFTSLRHRENLALAMLTGRKRPPGPDDHI